MTTAGSPTGPTRGSPRARRFELLLKGGRVIDPAQGLDRRLDVGVEAGLVAALAADIPREDAEEVLDVTDALVTPGLIDFHIHPYVGVNPLAVAADALCGRTAVTTAVSCGDAGAHTFDGLRRYVIEQSRTRLFAFVHISTIGLAGWPVGEMLNLDYADADAAARTVLANEDICLGIKVRETRAIVGEHGLAPLRRAILGAELSNSRVMVHVYDIPGTLPDLLDLLRSGDIVTHCYVGTANGILDERGRIVPAVSEARARGILFDLGHGSRLGFSVDVAERAIAQGFIPDTISTDAHVESVSRSMQDLPTVMSKLLNLGVPLVQVVECVTSGPGRIIDREPGLGTLEVGSPADIAVLALDDGDYAVTDDSGQMRPAKWRLRPMHTIRHGSILAATEM